MRNKRFFTLLELVIVMAIAAVLIAIIGSSFSIVLRNRIEMQSRKLASDLIWVRELSVSQPSNISGENYYTVAFNSANLWYGIFRGNADAGNVSRSLKQTFLTVGNISVTHPDAGGNVDALSPSELRFYSPSGTMVSAAGDPFVTPRNKACVNLKFRAAQNQVKVYGDTGYVRVLLNNTENPLSDAVCD
jgi:prepilin-type N-terminal cleavage/methylation domain-containing protein